MTELLDILASKLLPFLLRVCEDMTLPAGELPTSAIAKVGETVQAGFAAPGEVLPLAIVLALFLGVAVHLFSRGKARVEAVSKQALHEDVEPTIA